MSPLVLDAEGRTEFYTWMVRLRSGHQLAEQEGYTFSTDVLPGDVAWLVLAPQYPGLPTYQLRIPPGAEAWFTRRRNFEGTLGNSRSHHLVETLTGAGWRVADGPITAWFVAPDGSCICGIDDGTLTEVARR